MLTREPIAMPETPEWHAARSTGIGASELAAAAGLSEYETPLHIYARKRGEIPDQAETVAMRLGKRLEPVIVAEFADESGRQIQQYPMPMYRHPQHAFLLATPDAAVVTDEGLECKATSWRQAMKLGAEGTDDLPARWVCQCQAQMAVMSWGVVHLAVLLDGRTLKTFIVERNEPLIAGLIEAASDLWDRIQEGDPPEPEWSHPRTPELIRQIHQTVGEGRVMLSGDSVALWTEYESLGKQAGDMQKRRDELKARVLHEIGDHFAGVLPDSRMVRRKVTERKGYTVEPTSFLDIRAVKFDGGPVFVPEGLSEAAAHAVGELDTEQRFDAVHDALLAVGFVHYDTSDSGSRYYVTDDGGERVRVADHAPNAATAAWIERRGVQEIRVDDPDLDVDAAVEGIVGAVLTA